MAKLKLDYYKGKDLYSDGDVENELLEIAKSGLPFPTEAGTRGDSAKGQDATNFPVLYHFARVRENILNWYPFAEGAACLEIGSGCGAVTGLLCRRMARVISVELSKRRAEVNFERHKVYENLEIWVGNLNDMQFDGLFDYVILNGVFEYAESFTPGDDPYGSFLENIRRFLKPDGVILVAIENRLGLKYFAGAPEDHTDGYFDGIRGYEKSSGARTFSRGEWEALMKRCGLPYYKFYYPYPDYKFPQEIFTDASLKEQRYGRPTWNFTKYRMALFEETKMAATLSAEGVMAQFANSFLIEMSAAPLQAQREIQYVKLSTDRADEFSIATLIEKRREAADIAGETARGRADQAASEQARDQREETAGAELAESQEKDPAAVGHTKKRVEETPGAGHTGKLGKVQAGAGQSRARERRVVVKRAMTEAAGRHIARMLSWQEYDCGSWRPLRGTAEGDGIVYPFLEQKSLAQLAADAVQKGDLAAVKELVGKVADNKSENGIRFCFMSERTEAERERFREVFGEEEPAGDAACICPANIDLILDNLFETGEGYQVIDCEWIFDFPVPVPFVLWRAVNELYSNYPALEQQCPKTDFLAEFGIDTGMDRVFWDWSTHFAEKYVGANRMLRFSRPEIGISIEEFRQRLREKEHMISQLFVDTGNGYSEEQKLVAETELADGAFSVSFDLGQFSGVRSVRFDPLEGKPCICRIDAERTTAKLQAENAAAATPEGDLFLTFDPIYRVKRDAGADRLTISGEIKVLSVEEALARANGLLARPRRRFPFL